MLNIIGKTEFESDLERVYNYALNILSFPKSVEVNLIFVESEEIRELNKTTRNIDKVTDVLTYPYINKLPKEKLKIKDYASDINLETKTLTIGDIYICTDRAKEQANEFNHTLKREICFLFCHGMLHIAGYDHETKEQENEMIEMQERILNDLNITRKVFQAGFVTILGETNAGKSTLINQLVGEHVAIVSPKTQTTRENIQGIYNDDNSQIVFVDTPGYHKRANKIDDEMEKSIQTSQEDTEIVLMLIVANKPLVDQYLKLEKKISAQAKKILLINKIDEVKYEKLYPQLLELGKVAKVDEILPISALNGRNTDVLMTMVKKFIPTYDFEMRYYPVDEYTDKNLRHMVAEIIREKALLCLDDEIPHGVHVVVNSYVESEKPIPIFADMYCEKENHKAIILGKNGDMIKKISTMARRSIEKIVGEQINLQIYVKVKPNWRNDSKSIQEFGLSVGE